MPGVAGVTVERLGESPALLASLGDGNSVSELAMVVEGRTWARIGVANVPGEPGPARTRLVAFAEMLATAIANAQANDALRRLVEEHAARRRLATLAAEGAGTEALLGAIVHELARVLDVPMAGLDRRDSGAVIATTVAAWQAAGEPGAASTVSVPVIVDGTSGARLSSRRPAAGRARGISGDPKGADAPRP